MIYFYEFSDLENNSEANKHFSYLKSNAIFIECEPQTFSCKDRPIAVGELSVVVENLFIRDSVLPIENLVSL